MDDLDGWLETAVCHIYTVSLMCHLLPGSCGQFKDPSSTVPPHSKQEDHPKWRACTLCYTFLCHLTRKKKIGVMASKQVTRGCINSNPSSKGFVTFVFAYVHRSWWVVEWRTVTYRDHMWPLRRRNVEPWEFLLPPSLGFVGARAIHVGETPGDPWGTLEAW